MRAELPVLFTLVLGWCIFLSLFAAWLLGVFALGLIERRRRRAGTALLLGSWLAVVGTVIAGEVITRDLPGPGTARSQAPAPERTP